jgi:hypothetical protein
MDLADAGDRPQLGEDVGIIDLDSAFEIADQVHVFLTLASSKRSATASAARFLA